MPPIVIRLVSASDRSEWLRMRRLLWPHADPEALAREADSLEKDPMTPVFVAEREGGGLCGFMEAGTRLYADGCDTSPVGYLEGWYVDEDLRGTGIGEALVAEAEDWAREQGLHEMASDTTITDEVGLKAHLALGYKEMEHLIHFAKAL
jgi:aminoglycoside 6'-N-acetyltransferase I